MLRRFSTSARPSLKGRRTRGCVESVFAMYHPPQYAIYIHRVSKVELFDTLSSRLARDEPIPNQELFTSMIDLSTCRIMALRKRW